MSESDSTSTTVSSSGNAESICLDCKIINDRWLALTCIGRGANATIWLCYDLKEASPPPKTLHKRTGKPPSTSKVPRSQPTVASTATPVDVSRYYAVKVFSAADYAVDAYDNEIKMLRIFTDYSDHGHMKIIDTFTFTLDDDQHRAIVLPLCMGNILSAVDDGRGCDIDTTRNVLRQLFTAVNIVHSKLLAHGDLKPENILVDGVNAKTINLIKSINKRINLKNYIGRKHINRQLLSNIRSVFRQLSEKKTDIEIVQFDLPEAPMIRISDFGTCVANNHGYNSLNTVYYNGIEGIFKLSVPDNRQTDIWALACTAWEIMTGTVLFDWKVEQRDWSNSEDEGPSSDHMSKYMFRQVIRTLGCNATTLDFIRSSNIYGHLLMTCGVPKDPETIKADTLMKRLSYINSDMIIEDNIDHLNFIDMLYMMLEIIPDKRPTINQLLEHPFFTTNTHE